MAYRLLSYMNYIDGYKTNETTEYQKQDSHRLEDKNNLRKLHKHIFPTFNIILIIYIRKYQESL